MANSKNSPATISIAEALTTHRDLCGGLGAVFFGGPVYKALVEAGVQPSVAEAAQLQVDEKAPSTSLDRLYEVTKESNKLRAKEDARLKAIVDHLSSDITVLHQVQQRTLEKLERVEKIAIDNKPEYHEVLSQLNLLNDRYNRIFNWARTIMGCILVGATIIVANHFDIMDKLSSLGIKLNS